MAELIAAGRKARRTEQTYAACWRLFVAWCEERGAVSLPASEQTVCRHLAELNARGRKPGTLRIYAQSIRYYHAERGFPCPTGQRVRALLAGAARIARTLPASKAAITPEQLRRMLRRIDRSRPIGARNAALLLLGFSTGLRRSDLAALEVEDVDFQRDGLVVTVGRLRREKQDQTGRGRKIGVRRGSRPETCPVLALEHWLELRRPGEGPLFTRFDRRGLAPISSRVVALVVKAAVSSIGLDPARYSGHSLRAGMITACHAEGASDAAIMLRSGHKTPAMIAHYVRLNDPLAMDLLAGIL